MSGAKVTRIPMRQVRPVGPSEPVPRLNSMTAVAHEPKKTVNSRRLPTHGRGTRHRSCPIRRTASSQPLDPA